MWRWLWSLLIKSAGPARGFSPHDIHSVMHSTLLLLSVASIGGTTPPVRSSFSNYGPWWELGWCGEDYYIDLVMFTVASASDATSSSNHGRLTNLSQGAFGSTWRVHPQHGAHSSCLFAALYTHVFDFYFFHLSFAEARAYAAQPRAVLAWKWGVACATYAGCVHPFPPSSVTWLPGIPCQICHALQVPGNDYRGKQGTSMVRACAQHSVMEAACASLHPTTRWQPSPASQTEASSAQQINHAPYAQIPITSLQIPAFPSSLSYQACPHVR